MSLSKFPTEQSSKKYVTTEKNRQNAKFLNTINERSSSMSETAKNEYKTAILDFIQRYDLNNMMVGVISETMKTTRDIGDVVRAIEKALLKRDIYISSIIADLKI